jgi:two-component system, NtrC family, sensor histidine kinase KinB
LAWELLFVFGSEEGDMLSLRQKLSLGLAGLLGIILIIGCQSIVLLSQLGASIDVILRENYRSVVACQEMKEALERIDSGVLFLLLGYQGKGLEQIRANESDYEKALRVELNNITLPGEGEKAHKLQKLFGRYKSTVKDATDLNLPTDVRRANYFAKLLPLFEQIKTTADEVLQMNQRNMGDANDSARHRAASAIHRMYFLLIVGVMVAGAFIFFVGRWVLRPITHLIVSANDIKAGNLDLVVKTESRDEIGQLSEAFNSMAESLRQVRRTREARLAQIQYAVRQAFTSLPDPVAVVDLDGQVQVATEAAQSIFGLRPNAQIQSLSLDWVVELFRGALMNGMSVEPNGNQPPIQCFINGDERYFRPKAVPILDREKTVTAVMIVLSDITQQRQQDDLKRGVISTVSHQLKTPLTSIRLAVHLLLGEDLGGLTERQAEVLIAAEEDAERLHRILEGLLDIGRIEAGKAHINFQSVSPHLLASDAMEPFRSACQDRGLSLVMKLPDDLPEVWVDPTRVSHVFANLLSNALKYTGPGGTITLSGEADEQYIRFSVSDTGKGISQRYLQTVFEEFFRIPDQETGSGIGLGLAIAKEIVEAHGGTITVASGEAEGSTFTFSLKRSPHACSAGSGFDSGVPCG